MHHTFVVVFVIFLGFTFASRKTLYKRTTIPQTWNKISIAPDDAELEFFIALPQQNLDILEEMYWDRTNPDSVNYQQWMEIEEINKIVASPAVKVFKVKQWLMEGGITKIKFFEDAFEVVASVGILRNLFNTEFHIFENDKGVQIIRQWGELSVPVSVEDSITMISGLSSFPFPSKNGKRIKKNGIWDEFTYVVPGTVYSMYSIPNGTLGNSSQGVIEWEQQSFDITDLKTFASQMGAPNVDIPTPDRIIGPNNPSTPGDESTLDIQWISVTGLGITNWFWLEGGTSWLYGFSVHFVNTPNVPLVISMSYGWNEEDQCEDGIGSSECDQLGVNSTAYVARVNVEFQKIGLRGVSLFASSGDSGANGRTDESCSENHFNPAFPAASPFVTAVGATTIVDAVIDLVDPPPVCKSAFLWWCASNGTEVAVSYEVSGFTSGGGFSNVAPMPDWQKSAVQAYLNTNEGKKAPAGYFNPNNRAYPDIAALGDRILIWLGSDQSIGGTSASCPMVAGIFSLLNTYSISVTGKPLGPPNQLIYKMAAEHPSAFTDVTVGDNSCTESGCDFDYCLGYYCAKGWDPVTGWGTPVYTEMLAYLKQILG